MQCIQLRSCSMDIDCCAAVLLELRSPRHRDLQRLQRRPLLQLLLPAQGIRSTPAHCGALFCVVQDWEDHSRACRDGRPGEKGGQGGEGGSGGSGGRTEPGEQGQPALQQ